MMIEQEMETLIRARYPLLYVVSSEEMRVQEMLLNIAGRRQKKLFEWSCNTGLVPSGTPFQSQKLRNAATREPLAALDQVIDQVEPAIYLFKDFHPFLAKGSETFGRGVADLFAAFRKEVLALDPCVTEEFMKFYVAYKAETNFVDVVPQARRLVLTVNMNFAEVNDPKGLCRDVTGMGRWGNGDVEIGLTSLDELPYAMGIVRQSFELQMGDGGQA
jgi:predicted transport protein